MTKVCRLAEDRGEEAEGGGRKAGGRRKGGERGKKEETKVRAMQRAEGRSGINRRELRQRRSNYGAIGTRRFTAEGTECTATTGDFALVSGYPNGATNRKTVVIAIADGVGSTSLAPSFPARSS